MKKILSLFMSIVMIISITVGFDLTANAEVLTGDCGENDGNVTYTLDTETGVLTIYGTGKMDGHICSSGAPWYDNSSSVKTVIINSGVTNIGGFAFSNCSSLTSVTIPDSVTSIDVAAFEHCNGLTNITIPKSVTSIGNSAFWCCSSLTSITIPDSVTSINECAFGRCSSLTSVTIPDNVISIGNRAFEYCSSLTSITIPDSVTSIGDCAFEGCDSLTSITIPDSVTSIDDCAFSYCSSLTDINVDSNNQHYSSLDGVLFSKDKTELIKCPIGKAKTSYIIPDSVTSIGDQAFLNCSSLADINVDSNNQYYSSSDGVLFNKDKTDLIQYPIGNVRTSYIIPDSVTNIGGFAFSNCSSLTSVTIPGSVINIGDYAFCGCSSLVSVTILDGVTSIGEGAFDSCDSLISIAIPDSVTTIVRFAFYECGSLKDVYYTGTEEQWNNIKGSHNDCLTIATIHYNSVIEPTGPSTKPTTEPTIKPSEPATKPTTKPSEPTTKPTTESAITTTTQPQQEVADKNVTTTKPASIKVGGKVYKLDKNGDYVSSKVKKPSISKTTKAKKSFKATWKKVSAVSGYEAQYSTSKKFTKKTTKTKTVKGNKSKKPSLTIKNLKSKKTYYVRVRTYKTTKVKGKTAKVYSSWSRVKSVKIK